MANTGSLRSISHHVAPIKERVSLSIIYSKPQQKFFRMRYLFLGLAGASTVAVLLLNVGVGQTQYEITKLSAELNTLSQENQALSTQATHLKTPQNLYAEARELGMVSGSVAGSINIETGEVIHPPAAEKEEKLPVSLLQKPDAPVIPKIVKAAPVAEAKSEPVAEVAPLQVPVRVEVRKDDRSSWNPAQLNGGSIPAPAQKSPQP